MHDLALEILSTVKLCSPAGFYLLSFGDKTVAYEICNILDTLF